MGDTGELKRAYLKLSEPSTTGGKPGGGKAGGAKGGHAKSGHAKSGGGTAALGKAAVGKTDWIYFSFNPKEFTLARTAEWKAKQSKKPTMPEYSGSKPASVSLEMFLDASAGGSVMSTVDQLFSCVAPHPKTVDTSPSPPFVSFGWGTTTYLEQAVVKSVSVKFTRFDRDGLPIRATATVTIEEIKPTKGGQNPTSGSTAMHSSRVVDSGDTLASIAYEELGEPAMWRSIADANGIDDGLRIRAGTRLVVPSAGLNELGG